MTAATLGIGLLAAYTGCGLVIALILGAYEMYRQSANDWEVASAVLCRCPKCSSACLAGPYAARVVCSRCQRPIRVRRAWRQTVVAADALPPPDDAAPDPGDPML
jgi:hypothetical protein